MAKSSHVPKFGNWESDNNVPYTDFFENARKQKTGVSMNPNDPEENPEAFMPRNNRTNHNNNSNYKNGNNSHMHKEVKPHRDHGEGMQGHNKRISTSTHQNSVSSYKSTTTTTSESNSEEKSTSESSLMQNRRARKSQRKKSDGLPQLAQGHTIHPSRSHSVVHSSAGAHHRATSSIPKFGAWDEADPSSGEGFTAIFENVKEERLIGSTNFPSAQPSQSCNYNNARTKRGGSSFKAPKSKVCCGLF